MMRLHTCLAWVGVLLLACMACDRIEVRPIATQAPLEDAHPAVVGMQLRPEFFAAVSGTPSPLVRELARVTWTRDFIEEVLGDGTQLVMGPFEVPLELEQLDLTPTDEGLVVAARYASASQRTSLRFVKTGAPTICRIDIDLRDRTLEFLLTPGAAGWEASVLQSLSAGEDVGFAATEACAYPLETLDWALLSSRIDAILAGTANAEFLPQLRDLIVSQLSLPNAGVLMVADAQGYFEPRDVRLATVVSGAAAWGNPMEVTDVFGVRVMYDAALSSEPAPCVEGLSFEQPDIAPLLISSTPRLSPSGKPFDILFVVDKGFVAGLLGELTTAGYACADMPFGQVGSLAAFDQLFPEIATATGFNFGRRGRVRVQPRGLPTFSVPTQDTLRWWLPEVRFAVYGADDDVYVQVADVTAGLRIDTVFRSVNAGAIGFQVTEVEATDVKANLEFLSATGVSLDAQEIAARLGRELLENNIQLPLPTPFGYPLDVADALERQGALWFYLTLNTEK